jgi:hypothetical protein
MRLRVGIGRIRFRFFCAVAALIWWDVLLGAFDDSLVVDYVRRCGDFVGLLALAAEDWHWAHAGRCHSSVVREGISVSFYVYACAFYDFVDFG